MKVALLLFLNFIGSVTAASLPESQMVTELEKTFQSWNKNYQATKPTKPEELVGKDRVPALSYLRYLVEMEGILLRLREDDKTREKQLESEALSSSDGKKILSLRERALTERVTNVIDPPKRGPEFKDQKRLAKSFTSKAKRFIAQRDKAQHDLDKLMDRERPNEREEKKLDDLLEKASKTLAELELAFHGPTIDGYEAPFASTHLGKSEDLLEKIITARDGVLKNLRFRKGDDQNEADGEKEAEISGITVRSEQLGVLLDASGSMKPYLQPLRDEISNDFPYAIFRECHGCALNWQISGLKKATREQVLLFMEDLVIVEKCDAIYWFSDLNDPITDIGLTQLSNLRNRGEMSFYVLSVKNKPSREFMEQIDSFSKHKGR